MTYLIDKSALVAVIEKRIKKLQKLHKENEEKLDSIQKIAILLCIDECKAILSFIDTLEVKDPYEQCIQYSNVNSGIQAHAETYSFNIESKLFSQLTKEQQVLWRKEIEQACISGGEVGVELARDPRYKENLKVKKEVDFEKELQDHIKECLDIKFPTTDIELIKKDVVYTAKKFFELGIQSQFDKKLVEEICSHLDDIKDTADRMTSGNFMHHRAAIKFSANTITKVLELIGIKAQKGE